jgi:hypothetical protein
MLFIQSADVKKSRFTFLIGKCVKSITHSHRYVMCRHIHQSTFVADRDGI